MAEYIERKALIERFKKMGLGEHGFVEKVFADGVYSVLEIFPSANVAPVVHGKWLIVHNQIENAVCSACGTHFQRYYDAYSYCPHCGAKMDLEEQNNA